MASISKRGSRWLVQIRRNGIPSISRTFETKRDAKAWAAEQENQIEQGHVPTSRRLLSSVTFGAILDRYSKEIAPSKRGAEAEQYRLRQFQRDPVARATLANLTIELFADYRDRRLETVSNATVRRELAMMGHVLEVAMKEWGYRIHANPVSSLRQMPLNNARNRRLAVGEEGVLLAAAAKARTKLLLPIVRLAIETAMRRGEIINLSWEHIDLRERVAHIPITKTGKPRSIPLTPAAVSILEALPEREGRVFRLTANALRLAWERTTRRAGIEDLHFHDLRHEAISRFFELGLSMPEVATISGHRDPRMLFRYTHLRPLDLAQKLAGRSWSTERQAAETEYRNRQAA